MSKSVAIAINNYTISDYSSGERYGDWNARYGFSGVTATLGGSGRLGWNTEIHELKDEVEELTPLWVVVVVYSTGDTFGHSTGNTTVATVCYSYEDAEAAADAIREDNTNSRFGTIKVGDSEFYNGTWKGYFESLEDIRIEKVRVEIA